MCHGIIKIIKLLNHPFPRGGIFY